MTQKSNKTLDFVKRNDWELKLKSLYKNYTFLNFSSAISFINDIADISEEKNHHPKLVNSYNSVEVFWTTNDVGYITELDIELAEKSDNLYLKYSKK
jgi:4a-hydroxytetrahydrobiopterin dehydratase